MFQNDLLGLIIGKYQNLLHSIYKNQNITVISDCPVFLKSVNAKTFVKLSPRFMSNLIRRTRHTFGAQRSRQQAAVGLLRCVLVASVSPPESSSDSTANN